MHNVQIITGAYCDFCGTAESRCASAGGTVTALRSWDNMQQRADYNTRILGPLRLEK